jgi:S-methylmethionine-dependent homocysteine/selenocysteine methylase
VNAAATLNRRLAEGEVVVLDGGIGTEIQARGAPMHDAVWSARANLEHLDLVQAVHEAYIRAGADVILTNTFSSGRMSLHPAGLGDEVQRCNRRAVEAALRARDQAATNEEVVVAGAISPFRTFAMVPLAERASERRDVAHPPTGDALREAFSEQASVLADGGVDLLALETITSPIDGHAALDAALETGLPVWLGLSPARRPDGELGIWRVRRRAEDSIDTFEELVHELVRPELAAVTVMHCSVDVVEPALETVTRRWDGPLGAYPEHGSFSPPNWQFSDLTPEHYLAEARRWVDAGARIVGGCCGVRPEHIRALANGLS